LFDALLFRQTELILASSTCQLQEIERLCRYLK
jgi:hypothetical protein